MIDLGKFGIFGLVIFLTVLVILEAFFLVMAYYIPRCLHFEGIALWVTFGAIFIIFNIIFVNIE